MAKLVITALKCVRLQDAVGPDTVKIVTDGELLSGPHIIRKGMELPLHETYDFTGSVKVTLVEVDGKSGKHDDTLGDVTVHAGLAGLGDQDAAFDDLTHAFYNVTFHVDA
jgi:hypothetical protein